jgi:hypothetical protein
MYPAGGQVIGFEQAPAHTIVEPFHQYPTIWGVPPVPGFDSDSEIRYDDPDTPNSIVWAAAPNRIQDPGTLVHNGVTYTVVGATPGDGTVAGIGCAHYVADPTTQDLALLLVEDASGGMLTTMIDMPLPAGVHIVPADDRWFGQVADLEEYPATSHIAGIAATRWHRTLHSFHSKDTQVRVVRRHNGTWKVVAHGPATLNPHSSWAWYGRNDSGNPVRSGYYYVRWTAHVEGVAKQRSKRIRKP